ncbi:MAG: phosphoglucomutase (alpha-D-glucose-1,6-bisphosphate-dependent) [Bdellovibrionota bacterium]
MAIHMLAGTPAPKELLIDVATLVKNYHDRIPDVSVASEKVAFGTSGHRGTSTDSTFTEAHILAITQAICEYRKAQGYTGPIYVGRDSHALSGPAERSALEVLAANEAQVFIAENGELTPTPVISRLILAYNQHRSSGLADGIVITPSHNPPTDGGFKYNPPHGGPADTNVTKWIEDRANELLRGKNSGVKRIPIEQARKSSFVKAADFISPYVDHLSEVVDMNAIAGSSLRAGVDPLGGASLPYWERIREQYKLNLEVVNTEIDPRFGFMSVDHDGKIRMDCSSPYAMAKLLGLKDRFDLAFGNDPDSDRHGIVTPSAGLLNPNHYLAVCVSYLFRHRDRWSPSAAIGKTLVSSSVIDRVAEKIGRKVVEVPVGFKWFVPGLLDGTLGFGGEESAGASFLRFDGGPWSTDKDGIILNLLACEMTAKLGKDPGVLFEEIVSEVGRPYYRRIDQSITLEQKARFKKLSAESVTAPTLAGEKITAVLTRATGNNEPIGGVKVATENGWFAARPSGTENVYKLYAESMSSEDHLERIIREGQDIVANALSH